jgi:hypothetical protein
MKHKVLVLVFHNNRRFNYYGIHEALMDGDDIYWVGSKPLRTFDDYDTAVTVWGKMEPKSSHIDIMEEQDAEKLYDKVDYEDVEELNFDE